MGIVSVMMETNLLVESIDTHTMGEPTRLLTGGLDMTVLSEQSVEASRDAFQSQYDWLRQLLVQEPRGHADMFGAVPVYGIEGDADFGLFFFDNGGYLDMCGHGTIGVITALIETGQLPQKPQYKIETPAGIVTASPTISDGKVQSVQIDNVPSYVLGTTTVELSDVGAVEVDLVYSGNVVALVDATQFEFSLEPTDVRQILNHGTDLKQTLNANDINLDNGHQSGPVTLIEFFESRSDVDRNVVVFGNGSIDRSPCGTGTCAKMTLLHSQGKLSEGGSYPYESILGTEFTGRIRQVSSVDGNVVVHPVVSGSAHITGKHTFIRDPEDEIDSFHISC